MGDVGIVQGVVYVALVCFTAIGIVSLFKRQHPGAAAVSQQQIHAPGPGTTLCT